MHNADTAQLKTPVKLQPHLLRMAGCLFTERDNDPKTSGSASVIQDGQTQMFAVIPHEEYFRI